MSRDNDCIIITAYIEGRIRDILDAKDAFVICADGGYEKAVQEGIRPDLIMGDFDSFDGTLPCDIDVITHPAHKDDTDTGLALRYALENGYRSVIVVGGLGGRLDHTVANIQDIVGYSAKGLNIIIMDARNELTVIRQGSYEVKRRADRCISLFAFGGEAIVSISGVEYPLDHHTLSTDFPLGVSNEFLCDTATVTVHSGTVLLLFCK